MLKYRSPILKHRYHEKNTRNFDESDKKDAPPFGGAIRSLMYLEI
jgi:hypothetical protein